MLGRQAFSALLCFITALAVLLPGSGAAAAPAGPTVPIVLDLPGMR